MDKFTEINDLDTPCLLLDYDVMLNNIKQIHKFLHGKGKQVRSHVKAHKCSQIARLQLDNGADSFCTANLSEAVQLFEKGFDDILITRPIVEKTKINEIIKLVNSGKNVTAVVDNEEILNMYNSLIPDGGNKLKILLDINPGFGRTGLSPEAVIDIAERAKDKKNIIIDGLQAYAGHVQHIKNFDERKNQSLACMKPAAEIFKELKRRGFELTKFSGGGTGTINIDIEIEELTEFQIGSYVLMDAQYLEVEFNKEGVKNNLPPSLSVLSTVISNNIEDYVTIDAGLKSIYRDSPDPLVMCEQGNSCSYNWFGDEYGKISFNKKENKPRLGSKVRIIPAHCDPTVNLYDNYYVISGDKVIDKYQIDLRGLSQ